MICRNPQHIYAYLIHETLSLVHIYDKFNHLMLFPVVDERHLQGGKLHIRQLAPTDNFRCHVHI